MARASSPLDTLAVLAIFRNECHAFEEWLTHYRWQGVAHFYLIDNGSNEQQCTRPSASDLTWLSWTHRPSKGTSNQANAYNAHVGAVQEDWVVIVDLDEFFFGVNATLAGFLRSLPPVVGQLCAPWISFGSSGLVDQPTCVTKANVRRRQTSELIGKCAVRVRRRASTARCSSTRHTRRPADAVRACAATARTARCTPTPHGRASR